MQTSVETELYQLLEIDCSATTEDIKKAYRNKAKNYHPDKGGDPEVFKQINFAYEVLSNPRKREIYDKKGKNGFNSDEHSFEFPDFLNIFQHIRNFISKTPPIIQPLYVSLEDLCTRKIAKIKIERNKICDCVKNTDICSSCSGKGFVFMKNNLFGFFIASRAVCEKCKGSGKIYNFCQSCDNGKIKETKKFKIHLNPELEDGYKYIFSNEGNHDIDKQIGDFIVVVKYKTHDVFTVENDNLITVCNITLKEALCGYELNIIHPSGEEVKLLNSGITNPDTVRIVENKGLNSKGYLKVHFKIKFPTELSKEQIEILSKNL